MIGLALALTSAIAYGLSDFYGGLASRQVHALRVVLVSYPLSIVAIGAAAPFVSGEITWHGLIFGGASGIAQGFAVWWFYAALASGPMSVVSPVTAVVVAAIPVGLGVAMGERPGALTWVGMVLALAAVVMVSKEAPEVESTEHHPAPHHRFTAKVAWLTVGSGVAFALNFVLIDQVETDTRLWPLLSARIGATVVCVIAALSSGVLRLPAGRPLALAGVVAALDVVANVTMLYAFHGGMLSLVSVLISLYPAATVVLAMVVLSERVGRIQQVGMGLALVAVGVIAASS